MAPPSPVLLIPSWGSRVDQGPDEPWGDCGGGRGCKGQVGSGKKPVNVLGPPSLSVPQAKCLYALPHLTRLGLQRLRLKAPGWGGKGSVQGDQIRRAEFGLGGPFLGGRLRPPWRGGTRLLRGRERGPRSSPLASLLPCLPSGALVQRRSGRLPRLPNCAASFFGRKGLSDVAAVAAAATQDSAPSP